MHWEWIAPLTLSLAVVAGLVSIVRSITTSRQMSNAVEKKSALQQEVLKQFASGDELNDFLNSPAGREFVAAAELPADDNPYASILRSVRGGIITTALGITLYFLNNDIGGEGLYFFGALLTVAGLAVLAAAAVSYALSRKWGLLPAADADENPPSMDA